MHSHAQATSESAMRQAKADRLLAAGFFCKCSSRLPSQAARPSQLWPITAFSMPHQIIGGSDALCKSPGRHAHHCSRHQHHAPLERLAGCTRGESGTKRMCSQSSSGQSRLGGNGRRQLAAGIHTQQPAQPPLDPTCELLPPLFKPSLQAGAACLRRSLGWLAVFPSCHELRLLRLLRLLGFCALCLAITARPSNDFAAPEVDAHLTKGAERS